MFRKIFFFWQKVDLGPIYLMHFLYRFAIATIGIFIPIYLLKLGYPLSDVFWYLMVSSFAIGFFSFFAAFVSSRVGLKKTIMLRIPFLIAFMAMIYGLEEYNFSLTLIALAIGVAIPFYWVPLHVLFTRKVDIKKTGSGAGKLTGFDKLAAALAPIFGAFIITIFSFKILFILVFLIIIFSVFPLFFFSPGDDTFRFEPPKILEAFNKNRKYFVANFFRFICLETEKNIWPIFVYLNLISVMSVGGVGSLFGLGSILFSFFIGGFSDKVGKSKLLIFGGIAMSVIFILKYFFSGEMFYYVISIFSGFFMVLLLVCFRAVLYSSAKKSTIDEFYVANEFSVSLGRITLYGFAFLFIDRLEIVFLIAAFSFLIFPIIIKSNVKRLENA